MQRAMAVTGSLVLPPSRFGGRRVRCRGVGFRQIQTPGWGYHSGAMWLALGVWGSFMRGSIRNESLALPAPTAKIQAPHIRVGFVPNRLQFELDIERRNPGRDGDHRIQVEL